MKNPSSKCLLESALDILRAAASGKPLHRRHVPCHRTSEKSGQAHVRPVPEKEYAGKGSQDLAWQR